MKINSLFIMLIALGLSINLLAQTNSGKNGLSFLKMGAGAREISMSEAISAKACSPFSYYYNPSLLPISENASIGITHNQWFQGVTNEFLTAKFSLFSIPLSFHLNSTSIPDIEIRTRPGEKEGTFSANYLSTGLASGFFIIDNLSVGAGIKFLYENIYSNESQGIGFDLALTKRLIFNYVDAAVILRNSGSMSSLMNESTALPAELRIGISPSEPFIYSNFSFLPSIEVQKYLSSDGIQFLTGIETSYNDMVVLRLGYRTKHSSVSLSTGLGIKYKGLNFDYAFVPFNNNLGSGNIISFYINL